MIDRENLIWDRDENDIEFAELRKSQNIPYSLEESLRFSYDHRALNRVEGFIKQTAEYLKKYGYNVPLNIKTWWTENDRITKEEQQRYLANIHALRDTIGLARDLPNSINPLPFQTANDIEQFLYEVEPIVENMSLTFRHFGSFNFGQDIYFPNFKEA